MVVATTPLPILLVISRKISSEPPAIGTRPAVIARHDPAKHAMDTLFLASVEGAEEKVKHL